VKSRHLKIRITSLILSFTNLIYLSCLGFFFQSKHFFLQV
jgi:hypothetical protein